MNIQIGKYWLSSDKRNYIISKLPIVEKSGKKKYPNPSYLSFIHIHETKGLRKN